jgi:hypothetical protein
MIAEERKREANEREAEKRARERDAGSTCQSDDEGDTVDERGKQKARKKSRWLSGRWEGGSCACERKS